MMPREKRQRGKAERLAQKEKVVGRLPKKAVDQRKVVRQREEQMDGISTGEERQNHPK